MEYSSQLPPGLAGLEGAVVAGRFVVQDCIGLGGMAAIFRGRHQALDLAVAIKVLRPQYSGHLELGPRFDREARIASTLEHPNCVQVFDCGVTDAGLKFMVMPLLEGQPLAFVLRPRIAPRQALTLALHLLQGLHYIHRRGIVHRDIKAENIFIVRGHDGRETVKLVDFGIAKLLDERQRKDDEIYTVVGTVVGTPEYMSPEQALGLAVDVRSDLYAVGILLYEMLTGNVPFLHDDPGELLRLQVREPAPPLPQDIPRETAALVARLLEKDADDRFQSAGAVIKALRSAQLSAASDPRPYRTLLTPLGETDAPHAAPRGRKRVTTVDCSLTSASSLQQLVRRPRPSSRPHATPAPMPPRSMNCSRPPSERSGVRARPTEPLTETPRPRRTDFPDIDRALNNIMDDAAASEGGALCDLSVAEKPDRRPWAKAADPEDPVTDSGPESDGVPEEILDDVPGGRHSLVPRFE